MAKMPVYDIDSGAKVGELEIPVDVIEAAAKVEAWMQNNQSVELCGLRLADSDDSAIAEIKENIRKGARRSAHQFKPTEE